MCIMCFLVFNISAIHNLVDFIRSKNKNKNKNKEKMNHLAANIDRCYGVKILNQIKI